MQLIEKKFSSFKIIFKKFWEHKVFKFAISIHIFYLLLGFFLTLLTSIREFNDFLVFYEVGKVFINDIENLYDPSNYLWTFRYFPLVGAFFVPFSLLPFDIAFIFINLLGLFVNILICFYLYKISNLFIETKNNAASEKVVFFISLYLIALPHSFNYAMGQINSMVSLFLLISLYFFLSSKDESYNLLGGIFVGLSITIKPITIFIIPFLVSFSFYSRIHKPNRKELKNTIIRFLGVSIPLFLNVLLFFIIPALFYGFVDINFTGSMNLIINNSFSITKLIINALIMLNFEISLLRTLQIVVFFLVLVIIGGTGVIIYIFRRREKNSILYGYLLAIVITLLVYFDSWDLHLLILIPLLTVPIISLEGDENKNNKNDFLTNIMEKSLYFFVFIDLALFGLVHLVRDFFPYNFIPTIVLIIVFIYVLKFLLLKQNE